MARRPTDVRRIDAVDFLRQIGGLTQLIFRETPMRARLVVFLLLITLSTASARAEVIEKAPEGFFLSISTQIDAPVAAVYQQFLNIDQWWDAEHSWFGSDTHFSIEPRAGGCFCETFADKSALHMIVSFVDPKREIRLIGGLGPLQGMALHGAMTFRFEPLADQSTRVVHEYRVQGYAADGLESLAPVVDAVQTQQIKRLAARFKKSSAQ
jgi:uncharacterized protein YndB with AHSA1/START domain